MTDHPISFNAPMIRALIEGHKTMTRRGIKNLRRFGNVIEFGPSDTKGYDWNFRDKGMRWNDLTHEEFLEYLPFKIGDRLWVRDAYYQYGHWEPVPGVRTKGNRQKWKFVPANDEISFEQPENCRLGRHHKDPYTPAWHKRLARYMPRKYSRLTLEITGVKVERLQDISEADAIAEGAEKVVFRPDDGFPLCDGYTHIGDDGRGALHPSARSSFQALWQSIYGPEAWDDNPWVAAYSFKVIRENIDRISK